MKISERLRELRKVNNLTQKAVSDATGLTNTGYQNYELGTRTPRLEQLVALADLYGVSLDYLVGRSDDPELHP